MSVFQDLVQACADQLRTDDDLPPARVDDDIAVALAQNRAADVLLELGTSSEEQVLASHTDWRTDIVVHVSARPLASQSAARMADLYAARVLSHLRAGNADLAQRLNPLAVIGINLNRGDRRLVREISRTDTAVAETRIELAIYHRTVADTLEPWPV